jgi:hypothetical protein
MSAARHETQAKEHEQVGAGHAAQYDPKAQEPAERCAASGPRRRESQVDACWSSTRNPTVAHLRMAEEHRRHAADHRNASAALREAEMRACGGIGANDRAMSPFSHVEDIESVEPLTGPSGNIKSPATETTGAIVTFRAVEGMTAEWLQRIVDCHLARNSSLGHLLPEMPDCPLVPKGVEARVSSTGSEFAVRIRASDGATAREGLARAQRLTAPAR